MKKKHFLANHSKSSAMLVSLAIHAVLIVVAISFVAVKVIVKEDPVFVEKRVKRPKMPPKKIQVPVETKKRKPKPKLRKRILSERKMADIKMPEMTGIKGGLGNMGGDGLGSPGFSLGKMDLFGSDKSMGNELTGTFYDLKQTADGKPTEIAKIYAEALELSGQARTDKAEEAHRLYISKVGEFSKSFNPRSFRRYFKAPQEKYASFFMIPSMSANAAPKAYGVDNVVDPKHWVAFYEGHFAAPESGYYRFCGLADDVLLVEVNGRIVLDASHPKWCWNTSDWKSEDENNRKWPLSGKMVIGDWIRLEKGKPKEIAILFGECPGGGFSCQLLIQQKGVDYKQVPFRGGTRPILPAFKTKDIPAEMRGEMKINPNEATLDGPSFGVLETKTNSRKK